MNVLKKPAVAWSIVVVAIIIAVAIGLFRGRTASDTPAPGPGGPAASGGYSDYTLVYDDAGVLSASTERELGRINDDLIRSYNCAVAVVTCNYGGNDLYDYAMDYAEAIDLGGTDFIVVLDISGDNYWLVQGSGLMDRFTNQNCSDYTYDYMERDFARGDYDGAVLALTKALAGWYADNF